MDHQENVVHPKTKRFLRKLLYGFGVFVAVRGVDLFITGIWRSPTEIVASLLGIVFSPAAAAAAPWIASGAIAAAVALYWPQIEAWAQRPFKRDNAFRITFDPNNRDQQYITGTTTRGNALFGEAEMVAAVLLENTSNRTLRGVNVECIVTPLWAKGSSSRSASSVQAAAP